MDGILNIDKPWGKTSFSIVSLVKRLSGEKRVGHAGTLDPAATGVLPVCLGQGTRVIPFFQDTTKAYRAQIEFGVSTDTYDATGTVTSRADPSGVSKEGLLAALASFRGLIEQTPPMYSALKHGGKPLYQLARAGIQVERKKRRRWVYRLELTDWRLPLATLEIECAKGTYIRSLADDLGRLLGCGANLKSLTRLRCGLFVIEDAVSVPRLEDAFRHGYWQQFLYPIDTVLSQWGAVVVGDDAAEAIKNGRLPTLEGDELPASVADNRCRAYTRDGGFLAVLCYDAEKGGWRPEKVFAASSGADRVEAGAGLDIVPGKGYSSSDTRKGAIEVQAYCFKCRRKVDIKNPQKVTLKNGRPATKGVCPSCGTKVFRIGQG